MKTLTTTVAAPFPGRVIHAFPEAVPVRRLTSADVERRPEDRM